VLQAVHICHHRNIGLLLDTYFKQHNQINFDLLVNSLVLHYKIAPEVEELVVLALKGLFNISDEGNFVDV
jgi:hypothetical protein